MIVSPPFLPPRAAGQTDDDWLGLAMRQPDARLADTGAPEGSFPLSHSLAWHNGVHLQAPRAGDEFLPVRAIADGVVVFANPPRRRNDDPDDPQNYDPFCDRAVCRSATWTDNGCVIVRHRTSIGAVRVTAPGGGAPREVETEVVFYSAYMHLSSLARAVPAGESAPRPLRAGDAIWRKDEVGRPGRIYDHDGQIHFEICLDTANLERLIGRPPAWTDPQRPGAAVPTADGRIDSVFGDLYVYVPAGAPIEAGSEMPSSPLRRPHPAQKLPAPAWVRFRYHRGACVIQALDVAGVPLGPPVVEPDGEYRLYDEACARHAAVPAHRQSRSSPSGWYEMLRFGRNIGRGPAREEKDPLPEDAAHWRRVALDDRQRVWLDLNAPGSFKFSDADFLPVAGWNFIDDDTNPNDQRCDSERLKQLIRDPDPRHARRMDVDELARRLGHDDVRRTLRRVFCRFPSEWDRGTIGARYGFVRESPGFKQSPGAWRGFEAHLKAMSFENLPDEYMRAEWRGHPSELLRVLGAVGWLSQGDVVRAMAGVPSEAHERVSGVRVALNKVTRKYCIQATRVRTTHFLAQLAHETVWFRHARELGDTRYFRTMYEVITPTEAAEDFRTGLAAHLGQARPGETEREYAARRPHVVARKARSLDNGVVSASAGGLAGDGARFRGRGFIQITGRRNYTRYGAYRGLDFSSDANVERIAQDPDHACDTAGYFWARERINADADRGVDVATVDRVGGHVNRGDPDLVPLHRAERRACFSLILKAME